MTATSTITTTTTTTTTVQRELSSSAPELQSVETKRNALMVTVSTTEIMMLDNGQSTAMSSEKKADMAETTDGNTMETDDSSDMNQRPSFLARINSMGCKNSSSRHVSESAATTTTATTTNNTTATTTALAGPATIALNAVNMDKKTKTAKDKKVELGHKMIKNGSPTIHLTRGLIRRQARYVNSILAIKLKTLFLLVNLQLLASSYLFFVVVQAGFWTFYFPNFLKPSGYNEITGIIQKFEADMNETKDTFSDVQYFWGLMQDMDKVDEGSIYPEESACADVFPLFRDMAIEYSYIDYEHFMKPMEQYHEILIEKRAEWYPEGAKSKTILPRVWEQNLYEQDLSLKIFWLSKLTNEPEYRKKREQMVNIWKSVKRNLDSSLPCIYLRYAYRQMAEDINQLALDNNLDGMREALDMVQAAYKRIDKVSNSDASAIKSIHEAMEKEERLNI